MPRNRTAPPVQVTYHRDTSVARLAAVAAAAAAVGASAVAVAARKYGPARSALLRPSSDSNSAKTEGAPTTGFEMESTDAENPAAAARKKPPNAIVRKLDLFQQQHAWAGLPFAVVKKFGDDAAGNLAAVIAYYGFLSLFPLLLALTTVLGRLLGGHPDLEKHILNSALAQFPVIGDQLRSNVHSLNGSGLALVVGVAGALWGGMGVMKAAGLAMDEIWEVPKRERPTFVRALVRAALLLVVLGGGVVATTILAGLGTSGTASFLPLKVIGLVAAAAVNVGVFLLGFRVLTVRDVSVRVLLPGATVAGLAFMALQSLGGYYVTHQLKGASQTYGVFAVVIGLLSWMYLQAQLTLLAAEVNTVLANGLWPRGVTKPLTAADKRAYAAYAEVEERRPEEDVGVGFDDGSVSH